jgi:hypothetical protein
VEFDTGDFGGESTVESVGSPATAPPGTHYTPPTGAEESSTEHEPDPEKGEGTMAAAPEVESEAPSASPLVSDQQTNQAAAPIDLLDDYAEGNTANPSGGAGTIDELD